MNNLAVTQAAIELQHLGFRRSVPGVFERHGFRITSVGTLLLAIRDDVSVPS
jgi:hypothetical protein